MRLSESRFIARPPLRANSEWRAASSCPLPRSPFATRRLPVLGLALGYDPRTRLYEGRAFPITPSQHGAGATMCAPLCRVQADCIAIYASPAQNGAARRNCAGLFPACREALLTELEQHWRRYRDLNSVHPAENRRACLLTDSGTNWVPERRIELRLED